WETDRMSAAATEWEKIHLAYGNSDGLAAGYWAGRAYHESGDSKRAEGLWQSVMARDSLSYYAVASARRLGVEPWTPPAAPDHFESFADLDSTRARLTLLKGMGLTDELGWERDALMSDQRNQPERLLAASDLLRDAGQASGSISLARRALRAGAASDARTFRL